MLYERVPEDRRRLLEITRTVYYESHPRSNFLRDVDLENELRLFSYSMSSDRFEMTMIRTIALVYNLPITTAQDKYDADDIS
jgi:hypothetical protein